MSNLINVDVFLPATFDVSKVSGNSVTNAFSIVIILALDKPGEDILALTSVGTAALIRVVDRGEALLGVRAV